MSAISRCTGVKKCASSSSGNSEMPGKFSLKPVASTKKLRIGVVKGEGMLSIRRQMPEKDRGSGRAESKGGGQRWVREGEERESEWARYSKGGETTER
eukprot:163101-Chlamydomonas_euryale.AAC.7